MHTAVAVDGDALHGAWLDVIGKHYLFGHASALSSQVYLHPNSCQVEVRSVSGRPMTVVA